MQSKLQLKTVMSIRIYLKFMGVVLFFEQMLIIMYMDTCGYDFQH